MKNLDNHPAQSALADFAPPGPKTCDRRLLLLQKQLAKYRLLIMPCRQRTNWDLVAVTNRRNIQFEVFSRRVERGPTIVTSHMLFAEWISSFCSERLTSALSDQPTHHVHNLEMNGESYRLKHSRKSGNF